MSRKLENSELNRLDHEQFKSAPKLPVVIILENVRSAMNVGSVFRSSDAFLVNKICLCGYTAVPPNKEIHKTALGATETVDWEYFQNTDQAITKLKAEGYSVWAVEQAEHSVMLDDFNFKDNSRLALIFGNEVNGVEQETINRCDGVIEIPQAGSKHSLNISVCAGIVIWESYRNLENLR